MNLKDLQLALELMNADNLFLKTMTQVNNLVEEIRDRRARRMDQMMSRLPEIRAAVNEQELAGRLTEERCPGRHPYEAAVLGDRGTVDIRLVDNANGIYWEVSPSLSRKVYRYKHLSNALKMFSKQCRRLDAKKDEEST